MRGKLALNRNVQKSSKFPAPANTSCRKPQQQVGLIPSVLCKPTKTGELTLNQSRTRTATESTYSHLSTLACPNFSAKTSSTPSFLIMSGRQLVLHHFTRLGLTRRKFSLMPSALSNRSPSCPNKMMRYKEIKQEAVLK